MSVLDLMNIKLLPFLKDNTPEFTAFSYAIDYYSQGKKKKLISQLENLTASFDDNIAKGAKDVLKSAELENF